MRLESIALSGFKSFGERTEIEVRPGITAVVGPNGCGKCLIGETPVLLADGRVKTIRELVDEGIQGAELVQHFDDGVAALAPNSGAEVLSLNPVTLKLEPRPVEAFIRRAAPPLLLRVRTRSGREVVTTHYHPFFSLEAGTLKVLTADELVEGVRLAVPRWLPVKPAPHRALVEEIVASFTPADRIWVPYSPELECWLGTAARWAGGWERLATDAGVDVDQLRGVVAKRPVKVGALRSAARAAVPLTPPIDALMSSRRSTIKVPQAMDGRLARFLGYLIAEGRNTDANQVWFVNTDPAINDDFARLASELFGVRPRALRYKARATGTLIFSRALCLFLDRVFRLRIGSGSPVKEVPPQLWTATDDVVAEFLGGLFEGDGYVHAARTATGRAMPYLEYVTASRRLAEGVVSLLLRLGVFPVLRPKVKYAANTRRRCRRTCYSVYVYGVEQVQRLGRCIRFVGAKQARLDAVQQLEVTGNPNLDLIPGGRALVRAAVEAGGPRVKVLRPLSPRLAAYVEGRCDVSRTGLREVARLVESHGRKTAEAASLVGRLQTLADSDVYWDEVVSIEKIPPPEPWVYDLTVAETHNFVAANVIAHNSNISDAVRWALGEQSAKSLRGQRMEDLIFHGSASRRPVGLAEVELVFSNDGTLTVPWSEIAVARRLYRTGESEYLLNKSATRLRDIIDLFAGTGANPRAYSVMDQDKLNHVLTAKPHERRVFIEEAAGIARYKQQRNETEGKLDGARQNLLRVRDVMEEVRRQLGSLERQAKKAQQYKALEQERQSLRLVLAAADYAGLVAEGERLESELATRRDREQTLRVRLSRLAAREAAQREALLASDHRLADLRQSLQKVQAELERLLERREQMGVQLRETTEESGRLGEEIRVGTERLAAIVGERETTRAALAEAERIGADRQRAADELTVQVDRHRAALGDERGRLEAMRLEQVRLAAERADLTRSAGELRERRAQLERRGERLAAELREVEDETRQLRERRRELEAARDRALTELASLTDERDRLGTELMAFERELGNAEARLGELRVALAARGSSLEALRELDRAREGYGSGVRALFGEEGSPRVAGVVGTVADLLEVPPELERAVEAVLGERLGWVVVERFEQARQAVAYLNSCDAGPATFLPLEHLPGPTGPLPNDNGIRWVARQVSASAPNLLHYLLGQVAVVEHLDQAEALWRRNGVVATYVTPGGEVLTPRGRLRGGSGRGTGEHSPLARKRQLRELEEEVGRLGDAVQSTQAAVSRLAGEVGALRERLAGSETVLRDRQAEHLAGEKDLEQVIREHDRADRHAQTVSLEARQVAAEVEETADMLGRLEHHITAAGEAEAAQEKAMAGLRAGIATAQERESALLAELTALRVEAGSVAERIEALGRELIRIDQMQADLTERLAQARLRQSQLADRQIWLGQEQERTDTSAHDVAEERDRVERDVQSAAEAHEAMLGDMRALEQDLRSLETELGRLVAGMHELELQATERRVRREELAQDAYRTWAIDEAALRGRHDPARDPGDLKRRVAELEERLVGIGAVNLVADEEYRELDERLTFLKTQHDDLIASIKDLEKALRGMTRTAQERFNQAFQEINREFARLFERLFEGGRAELRLVEAEEGGDPLDTGVELMAQPRGKRLQSVTLLSGGERALTGLALLFAIFYFRPSPFCVLDEVDAPLDDVNIHRFLRVLRELTGQTQFLVITHNRRTMEAADLLYGVTMEEPGLSKLVSVKLNAEM